MKIVWRGIPPGDTIHKAVCHNCKSVLEFAKSEAEYVDDQRDGDYLRIACPVCAAMVTKQAREP